MFSIYDHIENGWIGQDSTGVFFQNRAEFGSVEECNECWRNWRKSLGAMSANWRFLKSMLRNQGKAN